MHFTPTYQNDKRTVLSFFASYTYERSNLMMSITNGFFLHRFFLFADRHFFFLKMIQFLALVNIVSYISIKITLQTCNSVFCINALGSFMQQTEEFYTENKQDVIRRKKENWKPDMSVMWTCTIQWRERIICHKRSETEYLSKFIPKWQVKINMK